MRTGVLSPGGVKVLPLNVSTQAVAVLQAGGQRVGLERRRGRARCGGPVAGVLDEVGAAVEREHLAGADIDRGDRGVQLGRLLADGVGGLLGVLLGRLDGRVLSVLVEGRGDLQAAAADLGRVEPGRTELPLDHLEQEALGAAVALVGR